MPHPETSSTRSLPPAADPVGRDDASTPKRRVAGLVVAAGLIACCAALALSALLAPRNLQGLGLPDAGQLTTLGRPVVKAIFELSSVLTVGWLLAAAVLAPPHDGRVDSPGALRGAGMAASVWAVSALLLVPLTISDTTGYRLADVMTVELLSGGVDLIEAARHALISAGFAVAVAVLSVVVRRPGPACGVLVLALAGLVPSALSGHNSQAENHDLATDTMLFHLGGAALWVGGLVALLSLARGRAAHLDVITRRFSAIALVSYILVAVSGVGNALVRFYHLSDLWSTDYGFLILTKTALLGMLGVLGHLQRRRSVRAVVTDGDTGSLLRLTVFEVGFMAATIGVAVALARTASPPQPPVSGLSNIDKVLGYDLVGPGTPWQWLTEWRFDFLFGSAALVAIALYLGAVHRMAAQGGRWPLSSSVCWVAGCLLVLVATSSGIGAYAEAQFSTHMVSVVLLWAATILMLVGRPWQLALQVLPPGEPDVPGSREALGGLLHSPVLRRLVRPPVATVLPVGTFYLLYLTPLYDEMISSHIGQVLMTLIVLAAGGLFFASVLGFGATPAQAQSGSRLVVLLAAGAAFAGLGLLVMGRSTVLGLAQYDSVDAPWVTDLAADQRLGGVVALVGLVLPLLVVAASLRGRPVHTARPRLDRPAPLPPVTARRR